MALKAKPEALEEAGAYITQFGADVAKSYIKDQAKFEKIGDNTRETEV
ncbi:hypothetical protein [Campylobacter showae]|nr:hypothetical protein [Campylobacter showae]